ncbi:hypothetical protein WJX72_011346 [[Myrmecia] bisecta]|uniref:Diphthine--ammonia ligase n=1 Tax=[Myrmecia] bisecta TaxID=41462 RepID=A0AAW1PTC8_9CHLO
MKLVALVSGGKDSCYNILLCQQLGHEVVALANLLPKADDVDELDSYMYQTVGHQLVAAYAECAGLPLIRRRIQGSAKQQGMAYEATAEDEVEDMLALLAFAKEQYPDIQAVSSGAIASDYQRLRVEHVCARLGLTSLAFMWQQPQADLLQGMIDAGIQAVLVKVAAMGLQPHQHLGKTLQQMQPLLHKLRGLYGCNVCGEGGEYETLTLDCPLFTCARIVLDDWTVVLHSPDVVAPVGVLHPTAFHATQDAVQAALDAATAELAGLQLWLADALFVHLYLADMEHFAAANAAYCCHFPGVSPAARACVQLPLPADMAVAIDVLLPSAVEGDRDRRVVHVQSISSWAPSCIGPYSQATSCHGLIHMAGQIALDPATMQLVPGGRFYSRGVAAQVEDESIHGATLEVPNAM